VLVLNYRCLCPVVDIQLRQGGVELVFQGERLVGNILWSVRHEELELFYLETPRAEYWHNVLTLVSKPR